MVRYEFRVLCANRNNACNHTMSIMRNEFHKVKTVDTSGTYDHIGVIELKTPNDALSKKRELRQIAGNSIRSIENSFCIGIGGFPMRLISLGVLFHEHFDIDDVICAVETNFPNHLPHYRIFQPENSNHILLFWDKIAIGDKKI